MTLKEGEDFSPNRTDMGVRMATTDRRDEQDGVRFSYEEDLVTAIDVETGVAASGNSKADALAELADTLALHEGGGEEIEDEDAFLREIGLDPE